MIDFKIGDNASHSKIFTQEEVIQFSKLSLDENPVHYDKEYAKLTIFKKPIVHGFLSSSLIGGLFGSTLPGPGTIYLSQEMKFKRPIYVGEMVTARIEVINIEESKPIVTFSIACFNEAGEVAIEGEAKVTILRG